MYTLTKKKSLRAKYGKTEFYNGLHCSLSFEDAKKEIGFFFSNGIDILDIC